MVRIFGFTGSRRRRRYQLAAIFSVTVLLAGFAALPAQAVHDLGVFELEGNAVNDPAVVGDDWDNVCHQVTVTDDTGGTIPDQCTSAGDTTGASAVSWAEELDRNATIFTGGGSKDQENVSAWAWKDGAGGLPDKDNLLHGFAARYSSTSCPTGSPTPCDLLYFGSDRFDNSGASQEGFWFLQNACSLGNTKSGGGFNFTCEEPGTPGDPTDDFHRVGDLLVLTNFSNGGTVSQIAVYKWVGAGGSDGTLDFLAAFSNKCDPALADDNACGIVNPSNGTSSPWTFLDKSGNTTYLQGEFFEAGVNLSSPEINLAGECFATLVSETRSSFSVTATLKDFVTGSFAQCEATMSTTPSKTSVTPGEAVHDTATVTGNNPSKTPSGDVTFFLCSFAVGSTDTCDASDAAHTGTSIGTGTLSGSGAVATANSPDVNTPANPLLAGHYCFRAEWPGDSNYVGALTFDGSGECFDVAKINSQTVTTPVDGSGVETHSITLGDSIFDKAVVTGTAAGGDPTGSVTFFVCKLASGLCDDSDAAHHGDQVGAAKTLIPDADPATFTSSATSDAFKPDTVGRYCFRAEYGGSDIYNASGDSSSNECFTVTTSSSTSSEQVWLPNDSATVSSAGNNTNLDGTLSFTLYDSSDCTGTVLRPAETFTLTNATSPHTETTTNTTVTVSGDGTHTVSWEVVFTSSNLLVGDSRRCETSTVTIAN